jgi:hypothetical protein
MTSFNGTSDSVPSAATLSALTGLLPNPAADTAIIEADNSPAFLRNSLFLIMMFIYFQAFLSINF